MTSESQFVFDPHDPQHLKAFRLAIAGIIRDLLAAVLKESPNLIPLDTQSQWFSGTNYPANRKADLLLMHAAKNLQQFPDRFGGSLDSVPGMVEGTGLTTEELVEDLKELVIRFADPDELKSAAKKHRNHEHFEWPKLCRWDSLPEIRTFLNMLPSSTDQEPDSPPRHHFPLTVESPNILRFKENATPNVPKGVWRLLSFLLAQESQACNATILYRTVWKQQEVGDIWSSIDSLAKRTNCFLEAHSIPYRVSRTVQSHLVFIRAEDPPKSKSASDVPSSKKRETKQPKASRPPKRPAPKKKSPRTHD